VFAGQAFHWFANDVAVAEIARIVWDACGRDPQQFELEHMPAFPVDVQRRWPDCRIAMVHRTGKLEIGEASVLIAVSAPHRAEAFDACEYAIDTLKQIVPIWKKEAYDDGEVWLEYEHRLAQKQARERLQA